MALPIKSTPVLRGMEAVRFLEEVKRNENKPVPKKDYERAKKVYEKMRKKHGKSLDLL